MHPQLQISMYINSPGGVVTAGLAIYDTMQYIRCPVATLAVGQVRTAIKLARPTKHLGLASSLQRASTSVAGTCCCPCAVP